MKEATNQVAELLLETGKAHHAAFFETDGDDPEWPLWYAEYLSERLPSLLGETVTTSELVYLMIDSDERYRRLAPDMQWYDFYARELLEHVKEPGHDSGDFPFYRAELPSVTTAQMLEVDRAMIEDFQITLVQMMENAGRNLALLARQRFLGGDPRDKRVAVFAGAGGNGGGALVAARHLSNHGANVMVALARDADAYVGIPAQQLGTLRRMGVPMQTADSAPLEQESFDLIVDGLIGYSLRGAPWGNVARMISWVNQQDSPVLALDVPSGLEATTGAIHEPAIVATATMTLALPKTGLLVQSASRYVGELYLADIGVPPGLYASAKLGLEVPPVFAGGEIVRLR